MHVLIVALLLTLAWTMFEDKQGSRSDPEDFMNAADTASHPAQPDNQKQNE